MAEHYGVVPKELLTYLGFVLCNVEFSPRWALPELIWALIHLACLRVFSVTSWVIVYRLYNVRWQEQRDWFWKITLDPLTTMEYVISKDTSKRCRLISFSAYFPWNITLKYTIRLSEGFSEKILLSKSRSQCSWKDFFLFFSFLAVCLEAIHQSFGSNFRDFFVKTTKENEQPFRNQSMGYSCDTCIRILV